MATVTIYHNPRCSKSRQTLALLEAEGHQIDVIEYLKSPPSEKTLRDLLQSLDMEPNELIRPKEHRELGLPDASDASELIRRMAEHPQIIQRPIVVHGKQARIGRPPEQVLEIL